MSLLCLLCIGGGEPSPNGRPLSPYKIYYDETGRNSIANRGSQATIRLLAIKLLVTCIHAHYLLHAEGIDTSIPTIYVVHTYKARGKIRHLFFVCYTSSSMGVNRCWENEGADTLESRTLVISCRQSHLLVYRVTMA